VIFKICVGACPAVLFFRASSLDVGDVPTSGNKPPFFRNNPQGQPSFREPRKAEVGEKMPRPPPMECWGCKGNHRYRDYPHRKDKARTVHNVQQAETMEDMGSRMPRIYIALDNKQA
jgi:hypothetical protein